MELIATITVVAWCLCYSCIVYVCSIVWYWTADCVKPWCFATGDQACTQATDYLLKFHLHPFGDAYCCFVQRPKSLRAGTIGLVRVQGQLQQSLLGRILDQKQPALLKMMFSVYCASELDTIPVTPGEWH